MSIIKQGDEFTINGVTRVAQWRGEELFLVSYLDDRDTIGPVGGDLEVLNQDRFRPYYPDDFPRPTIGECAGAVLAAFVILKALTLFLVVAA